MSAIGMDPSLTTMEKENERLREELEEALHKIRKNMDTVLQELSRIKTLEGQIGQALNSLMKKRACLEEGLIRTSHSFDKLVQRAH